MQQIMCCKEDKRDSQEKTTLKYFSESLPLVGGNCLKDGQNGYFGLNPAEGFCHKNVTKHYLFNSIGL